MSRDSKSSREQDETIPEVSYPYIFECESEATWFPPGQNAPVMTKIERRRVGIPETILVAQHSI